MTSDRIQRRVCDAVRTFWANGVIDQTNVCNLFPRAKTKQFVCIVPKEDEDSLYRVTFLVDEKYRGMTIRVVPEANVLKMVVMQHTTALDGCMPGDVTIEQWAEHCLNADGVVNWTPYDDLKIGGFAGVKRRAELSNDWRRRETFGMNPRGGRYVMYEVNE